MVDLNRFVCVLERESKVFDLNRFVSVLQRAK